MTSKRSQVQITTQRPVPYDRVFLIVLPLLINPKITPTVTHYGGSADMLKTEFRDRTKRLPPLLMWFVTDRCQNQEK